MTLTFSKRIRLLIAQGCARVMVVIERDPIAAQRWQDAADRMQRILEDDRRESLNDIFNSLDIIDKR